MLRLRKKRDLPVIGWREWVTMPELGIEAVKAKIDTGARSSSLHALHIKTFEQDGKTRVRFQVHPFQREAKTTVECEADLLEHRFVRSSSGQKTRRPVIVTNIELLGQSWPIELTLANRDTMGFRMLLGREAFRKRFLIDPGASYHGGVPEAARRARRKKSKGGKPKT